jgi:hypothetical protein
MDLKVNLSSSAPNDLIRTVVYNAESKDEILERRDRFSGTKEVMLKLPMTSEKIIVETYNMSNGKQPLGKDKSFEVLSIQKRPLRTYNVNLGSGDREFLDFVERIARDLPMLPADGNVRRSPSGKFKIAIFDRLKSHSGEYVHSPAMVGKRTGTIEISKDYMMKMTISQRIAVMCHEYGHFYKNPLINLPIGDEVGADLNGMTIYLGRGYHISEYINAFKMVFNGAKTNQNRERYDLMKKFAHRIYNGEYFGVPYNLK